MKHPFISTCLYLQRIPEINGWGVFTSLDLEENMVIEVSPVIVYPSKLISIAIYATLAEGLKNSDMILDQYAINWSDGSEDYPKAAIMLGNLSLYNHSNNPNAFYSPDFEEKIIGIVTTRKILKGEQITVSYGSDWFEKKKDYLTIVDF